jgi:hypothetical protein
MIMIFAKKKLYFSSIVRMKGCVGGGIKHLLNYLIIIAFIRVNKKIYATNPACATHPNSSHDRD